MERYYLKMKGQQGPKVPHDTIASANAEAHRLLHKNPEGELVYVLKVIDTVTRDDLLEKSRSNAETKVG